MSFGISTTAEGVETQEQLFHLVREGCAEVQGWLFGKAIPADKVPAVLQQPISDLMEKWQASYEAGQPVSLDGS